MEAGDIFTIDQAALDEMKKSGFSVVWKDKSQNILPLPLGTKFRITRTGLERLPVEVRASKLDPETGKGTKGRPRRFPAAVVYRLLGETPPVAGIAPIKTPSTPVVVSNDITVDSLVDSESDDSQPVVVDQVDDEESRRERADRVAALLGLVDSADDSGDDW